MGRSTTSTRGGRALQATPADRDDSVQGPSRPALHSPQRHLDAEVVSARVRREVRNREIWASTAISARSADFRSEPVAETRRTCPTSSRNRVRARTWPLGVLT
jgi:hypothetical protein